MSLIKLLPEHLINQIAAGEVVERPASVVKELIENAIDAHGTRIEIHIKNAGKTEMKIVDDGDGMSAEDSALAFARHATSKIKTEEDLGKIVTLGFRGEALSSIASVSKVTLETKRAEDETGTRITAEGEKISSPMPYGCPKGTSISVNDLFFNTPARKKYLKSDSTELGHIISTVTEAALSTHSIHFVLFHNGRTIFDAPKTVEPRDRIRSILGRDTEEHLLPIFYGGKDFQIKGYIGKPEISRTSRENQYFFINGRSIQSNSLSHAVKEGFQTLLPHGKYPLFIMYLTIEPQYIDVNVHPRKTEIRFQNQSELYGAFLRSVKQSLETNVLAPNIFPRSHRTPENWNAQPQTVPMALEFTKNIIRGENAGFREFSSEQKSAVKTQNAISQKVSMKAMTQIANSYIIAQDDEGLVIIDQHAAHERCLFSALMKAESEKKPISQPLIVPLTLELGFRENQLFEAESDFLNNLGFKMEKFTGNTFQVTAVPALLSDSDFREILLGMAGDILSGRTYGTVEEKREKMTASIACRGAIKFGKPLTLMEQDALIATMESLDQKYTCPHGRPTMIRLTFHELEKRFGRI
ncbi:DNA mismatch repair endonuclease MutL [Candidatus Peregrinibacteria bacterium]|nr:DNA mismatch repair endonuclease MutL [Candidatus Peregrinibacteria bacterium]